ncbi:MFS transporter [Robinsoniella peoriensis]|uniref:MFS transporter n=1 Tax=Robinsoniella peoriensis TaxID=180332 RepID=UPI000693ABE8|nr:MFS transporter [Robinsoniella peoriensis]
MLTAPIFNSRIRAADVTGKEKALGYFLGPISVSVMASILSNYLNVYYTDVIDIADIGGGMFLSLFPFVCKFIDAITFVLMGRIVDRTISPQGKARPWILFSTPILLISMVLLFAVPRGNNLLCGAMIFISYNLFYSVGYTAYSTSHTLLVPLSTTKEEQRSSLSLISNTLNMVSGFFIAILFPCILVPFMGVDRRLWILVISIIAVICCPLLLFEYYYTVERVTIAERKLPVTREHVSLVTQLRCCLKSRSWIVFMIYMIILQLFNALSSTSIFYYCNWVLGDYNDGITQALYFGIGNAPMGLGAFLCKPLCKRFGRKKAMMYGYLLAVLGSGICCFAPYSLPVVLTGQAVKAFGLIPSCFMSSTLLADALDDVEMCAGKRCDGFSSSVYNIITTFAGGIAIGIFNFSLIRMGYTAPMAGTSLPVQNGAIRGFFIFSALGGPGICYLVLALLLR